MKTMHTFVAGLGLLLAFTTASATLVNISTGDVDISFDDQASYFLEAGTYYSGTFYQTYSTPPWTTAGATRPGRSSR